MNKLASIFLVVLLALSGCKSPPPPDIRVGTSYPTCSGSGVPGVAGGHQQAACVNGDAGFVLTASQLSDGGLGVPYFAPSTGGSSSDGGGGGVSSGIAAYLSRPAPGHAGAFFTANDGASSIFEDDGTEWRPFVDTGVLGWEVAPGNDAGAYTLVGGSWAASNIQGGTVWVQHNPLVSNSLVGYELPKTTRQTLTVFEVSNLLQSGGTTNYSQIGIWVRDTTSGKASFWCYGGNGTNYLGPYLAVYNFSSLGAYAATATGPTLLLWETGLWLQIVDTGSSLQFDYSTDGVNFVIAYTDTGPYVPSEGNVYGFGMNPYTMLTAMTVESVHVH
jgi:hypothetical protein